MHVRRSSPRLEQTEPTKVAYLKARSATTEGERELVMGREATAEATWPPIADSGKLHRTVVPFES